MVNWVINICFFSVFFFVLFSGQRVHGGGLHQQILANEPPPSLSELWVRTSGALSYRAFGYRRRALRAWRDLAPFYLRLSCG